MNKPKRNREHDIFDTDSTDSEDSSDFDSDGFG
jgi:hypothetical protein